MTNNIIRKYQIKKILNIGISNMTYIDQNDYFVRKSYNPDWIFVDRENELTVIEELEKLKPSFYIKLCDYGWDMNHMHFYEIKPFYNNLVLLDKTNVQKHLEQIYQEVKILHNVDIKKTKIKTFNYFNFYKLVKQKQTPPNQAFAVKERNVINYFKEFKNKKVVLSHQDLHKLNFMILNHKIKIIDFEFAILNTFLFDIASFITETLIKLNPSLIPVWIQKWNLTPQQLQIMIKICNYQNLVWYYWSCLVNTQKSTPDIKIIMQDKKKAFLRTINFKIKR